MEVSAHRLKPAGKGKMEILKRLIFLWLVRGVGVAYHK